MGLRIQTPTTKEFSFKGKDGSIPGQFILERCEPDGRDGFVIFRQGTNEDNEVRAQMMSARRYRLDRGAGALDELVDFNPLALARTEVRLTLADTDIQFPDGSTLEFETDGGARRAKSSSKFEQWWKLLPPQWADEIYRCCLEVNPDWGLKS